MILVRYHVLFITACLGLFLKDYAKASFTVEVDDEKIEQSFYDTAAAGQQWWGDLSQSEGSHQALIASKKLLLQTQSAIVNGQKEVLKPILADVRAYLYYFTPDMETCDQDLYIDCLIQEMEADQSSLDAEILELAQSCGQQTGCNQKIEDLGLEQQIELSKQFDQNREDLVKALSEVHHELLTSLAEAIQSQKPYIAETVKSLGETTAELFKKFGCNSTMLDQCIFEWESPSIQINQCDLDQLDCPSMVTINLVSEFQNREQGVESLLMKGLNPLMNMEEVADDEKEGAEEEEEDEEVDEDEEEEEDEDYSDESYSYDSSYDEEDEEYSYDKEQREGEEEDEDEQEAEVEEEEGEEGSSHNHDHHHKKHHHHHGHHHDNSSQFHEMNDEEEEKTYEEEEGQAEQLLSLVKDEMFPDHPPPPHPELDTNITLPDVPTDILDGPELVKKYGRGRRHKIHNDSNSIQNNGPLELKGHSGHHHGPDFELDLMSKPSSAGPLNLKGHHNGNNNKNDDDERRKREQYEQQQQDNKNSTVVSLQQIGHSGPHHGPEFELDLMTQPWSVGPLDLRGHSHRNNSKDDDDRRIREQNNQDTMLVSLVDSEADSSSGYQIKLDSYIITIIVVFVLQLVFCFSVCCYTNIKVTSARKENATNQFEFYQFLFQFQKMLAKEENCQQDQIRQSLIQHTPGAQKKFE